MKGLKCCKAIRHNQEHTRAPISDHISDHIRDRGERENQSALPHEVRSSVVFFPSIRGQQDNEKADKESENNTRHVFQEGPWKIRLIWRSFKEGRAPRLGRGGARKNKCEGERLGLRCCVAGTPTLSLVLFINLFHPRRASSDPHSSQREAIAFLSLLIPLHHTSCTYPKPVSTGAQRSKNHRHRHLVFHLHSQSKVKGLI